MSSAMEHNDAAAVCVPAQRACTNNRIFRIRAVAATGLALVAISCALLWAGDSSAVVSRKLVELLEDGGDGSIDQSELYNVEVDDDHAEPSIENIYNPSSDPDAPGIGGPAGRMKLQEGLQKVLQQAASTNALASSSKVTRPSAEDKPSNMYNPDRDPDAPAGKFSRFMHSETGNLERANKMKQRLKLEAKVAMLSSRETTTLAALKPKKDKKAETEERAHEAAAESKEEAEERRARQQDWFRGPPKRPGLKEITALVQEQLEKGADPDALLAKEKAVEQKYKREAASYARWKADGGNLEDAG